MNPGAKQIVAKLTGVLVQAAHPKRIILFGSQARGDAATHSGFDIIPPNRFAEMVRLNRLIRSFDIAVDLMVVSDEKFHYWRDTPGNVYYEAATRGLLLPAKAQRSMRKRARSHLGAQNIAPCEPVEGGGEDRLLENRFFRRTPRLRLLLKRSKRVKHRRSL